jgi:hypothetical protein
MAPKKASSPFEGRWSIVSMSAWVVVGLGEGSTTVTFPFNCRQRYSVAVTLVFVGAAASTPKR